MFWYYLVAFLHVLVCAILILVVLLQSGKGADLAGAFGGGGTQTVFGSRGPATFLSKLTTVAAVIFMLTCISLSLIGDKTEVTSVMDKSKAAATPAKAAPAAAQPQAAPPTPDQIKKIQQEIESKQQAGSGTAAAPAPAPAEKMEPAKAPAEKKAP